MTGPRLPLASRETAGLTSVPGVDARPADVAISETLSFVLESVGAPPRRLLEVGCGDGELAARLHGLGYQVVALDADAAAVRAACTRGVDARVAYWPDYHDDAPFDAVLFTRSLHHLRALSPAIERAASLLKRAGVVLVEDFAFQDANEPTVQWFQGLLRGLEAAGTFANGADCFARSILESDHPFAVWHHDHEHELNAAEAMRWTLAEHFDLIIEQECPYLYRYVIPLLSVDEAGSRVLREVLAQERAMAARQVIVSVGRRLVGRSPIVDVPRGPRS
ncbi:MAG TPA: methyltransferase domain-containing protein [Gemmatimonadaceae bacterium]|nr:methyltransferase domain-containing protein [Gemmatimonadaceae bacterium]